jgi:Ni/Co efflux regulator RcnB
MKKAMLAAVSAVTAMSFALSAVSVEAQPRERDRWERGERGDRWDRGDRRDRRDERRWRTWDNRSGWSGYRGNWRAGQRYNNGRSSRYYLHDWRGYGLPPPRRGYRYYRDSSGDIIMAAIATGVIASILTR